MYGRALAKKSMKNRVQSFYSVVKPESELLKRHDCPDLSKINELDDLRHQIIHGDKLGAPMPEMNDAIDLVHGWCNAAISMIVDAHKLPLKWFTAGDKKKQTIERRGIRFRRIKFKRLLSSEEAREPRQRTP